MLLWILLTSPDIARISDNNAANDAPGGVASMMDRGRATLGAEPGVADPLGTGPGQWEPAPGGVGRGGATMARGRTPAGFGERAKKARIKIFSRFLDFPIKMPNAPIFDENIFLKKPWHFGTLPRFGDCDAPNPVAHLWHICGTMAQWMALCGTMPPYPLPPLCQSATSAPNAICAKVPK